MSLMVPDLMAIALALLLYPLLLGSTGALVTRLTPLRFAPPQNLIEKIAQFMLLGLATLTPLLDIAGRLGGPLMLSAFAFGIMLIGAWFFIPIMARYRLCRQNDGPALFIFLLWIIYGIVLLLPWMFDHNIYFRDIAYDYIKHDMVSNAIAFGGTPPLNNFFSTPNTYITYYYEFHILAACLMRLSLGVIKAENAMIAMAIWTLPLLWSTLVELYKRLGWGRAEGLAPRTQKYLLILLLCIGLDLIPILIFRHYDFRLSLHNWYGENFDSWISFDLWVPHHLSSLIVCLIGFCALDQAQGTPERSNHWRLLALAALAFSSCFGMSIYIAIGAVLTLAVWMLHASRRGERAMIASLILCGTMSVMISAPLLYDIISTHAQHAGDLPIDFYLFGSKFWRLMGDVEDAPIVTTLIFIPIVLSIHYGIFAYGSYAFWAQRLRRADPPQHQFLHDVLTISAALGLVISLFFKTTILSNDLAWRIRLFPQCAMLLWTLAAWDKAVFECSPLSRFLKNAYVTLGLIGSVYSLAEGLLFKRNEDVFHKPITAEDHARLYDERLAWLWLNAHRPPLSVVQLADDDERHEKYGWGLFSTMSLSVSDFDHPLIMGVPARMIKARLDQWAPVFNDPMMGIDEVRALLATYHVHDLLISSRDEVWEKERGWPATQTPVYENPHFKIYHFD